MGEGRFALGFSLEKKHSTPFEMVELALEIQAPIIVFREWQRHRTQSYNEVLGPLLRCRTFTTCQTQAV